MNIYAIFFKKYEDEFGTNKRSYVELRQDGKETKKLTASKEKGLLVVEADMLNYTQWGGGYDKIVFVGELPDSHFKPVISETDIVNEKIHSKNGNRIGKQG